MQIIDVIFGIWKPVVEICILWFVFYRVILFFEGTRAFQLLKGIVILVLAFYVFQKFQLHTLNWLLTKLFAIWVIGILIIFQPELRYGLARLGQQHLFYVPPEEELFAIFRNIGSAIVTLSSKKIGALIAFERESGLKTYVESGVYLDTAVSAEIIETVFIPTSPLHDGGLIIQAGRIIAASCLFPLSHRSDLPIKFGMRHRAAIGLTEETDAVVVVVSEETGRISLVVEGEVKAVTDKEELIKDLKRLFKKKKTDEELPNL